MTKDLLMSRVAAIVCTLAETDGSPESMLYIFCDMNMADWEMVRDIIVRAKFVTISNHYVTLTEQGRVTARELENVMAR